MKKLRQRLRRAAAVPLGLLLCIVCLTRPVGAVINREIPVVSGEPCSLTLNFGDPGVTFHLYRVASVSADVRYTLLPTFSGDRNFPRVMDFNDITRASQWADLAATLHPYLQRYYSPLRTAVTDRDGVAVFDDLPVGLYLASGATYSLTGADGSVRDFQPSAYFICLPYWTEQDGRGEDWVYDLVVDGAKKDEMPHEPIVQRVIKIWDAGTRKEPVTVDLLQDGRVVDTVELSSRNNWRYEWTDLDPGCRWEVLERAGTFRVTISRTGGTYQIVNSDDLPPQTDRDDDPPGTPPPPDIPLDDPEVPLDQLPGIDPEPDPDPGDEIELDDEEVPLAELPQTGQLWWPVPLLALSGMILFLLGWGWHRRGETDGE